MLRLIMITHDRIDKKNPRADLIRFNSLGKALYKQSVDVVYITSGEKWRYEEGTLEGVKIYKVPLFSKSNLIQLLFFYFFVLPVLCQAKKVGRFNIIFVNSIFTIPVAWMLKCMSRNARIQFDLMGILSEEKFIKLPKNYFFRIMKKTLSSLEDFLWSHVDFITTINNQHKHLIIKRINKPVYVVRDGVFESVLRRSFNVNDKFENGKLILIFVGQINYFRLDPLFKILPSLVSLIPKLHVQVVGIGPHLNRYRKIVESVGLTEYVTFLGYIPYENVFETIAKADIAYSDDWSVNGFPMKLFEYMALGKAIVAEGTESVKELLTDNLNGLLYNNESELKEKILRLIKDQGMRKKLGCAARRIMDNHTWEIRTKELMSIYEQFCH